MCLVGCCWVLAGFDLVSLISVGFCWVWLFLVVLGCACLRLAVFDRSWFCSLGFDCAWLCLAGFCCGWFGSVGFGCV